MCRFTSKLVIFYDYLCSALVYAKSNSYYITEILECDKYCQISQFQILFFYKPFITTIRDKENFNNSEKVIHGMQERFWKRSLSCIL